MIEDTLFTRQEVAEKLGINPITVTRWINRELNPLACIRIGTRYVRITQQALDQFLASNSTNPTKGGAR